MDIRHLKIFLAIYETGTTTAASSKLMIAQPSISYALSELEKHYGVQLFERFAKRLRVTDEGEYLYNYARHVIDLFDSMEENVRELGEGGILRIGSSITIGNNLLPNYIKQLKRMHPQIKVTVIIENTSTIEKLILANQIDIGLIEGNMNSQYIINHPFMEDQLVMICSPEHPYAKHKLIAPEVLAAEEFIMREKGSAVRGIFENVMQSKKIPIQIVWESVSIQSIINAVSANLGVSILPYGIVKNSLERGDISMVSINGLSISAEFSIIYHQNKLLNAILTDFIEICKKQ
jgi:LysR family transcriptional regulator, transcriptional activator of the cysJI operon